MIDHRQIQRAAILHHLPQQPRRRNRLAVVAAQFDRDRIGAKSLIGDAGSRLRRQHAFKTERTRGGLGFDHAVLVAEAKVIYNSSIEALNEFDALEESTEEL